MTHKQKEMYVLAIHYYNSWSCGEREYDKRVIELLNIYKSYKNKVDRREVLKFIKTGIQVLQRLTEYENVTINAMVFFLGFIFLLIEEDIFKGSHQTSVKRLAMDIYTEWEKLEGHQDGFKLANRIITRYYLDSKGVSSERY